MAIAEHRDGRAAPALASVPAVDRLPVGFMGVWAPMSSLGFAPFACLAVAYEGALVLSPAAAYQISFSFQQKRIVERLSETPYADAAAANGVRIWPTSEITEACLRRDIGLGTHLEVTSAEPGAPKPVVTKFILQRIDLDRIRRGLGAVLGDRFLDLLR
jgi:hypothetical protein